MTAAFNDLDQDKHEAAIERQLDSLEDAVAVLQGADHLLTADGELWLATQQRMPPSERVGKPRRPSCVQRISSVDVLVCVEAVHGCRSFGTAAHA